MRVMLMMVFACFAGLAFAEPVATDVVTADPSFDIVTLIVALLGDKAAYAVLTIAVVGYVWAQLRQLIPAEKLSKLPAWVLWLLELLAANKGRAENAIKPEGYKQWRG